MNRPQEEVGKENIENFVCQYVRSPALQESEVFSGNPSGVLNKAEPPSRELCLQACLGHWRDGYFLRCLDFSGFVF